MRVFYIESPTFLIFLSHLNKHVKYVTTKDLNNCYSYVIKTIDEY